MRTLTPTVRWTLVVLAVLAVLMVALLREVGGPDEAGRGGSAPAVTHAPTGRDGAALDAERRRAALPPCPVGTGAAGAAALRGVTVQCAADGTPVDVGAALAGRPAVLNLWAYWCAPCRQELPALAEYQRRVGSAQTVITVHQDENEGAGLALLADLGVALPTLQDGSRRIAAALRVPNVMPTTVVLRADGTVAAILPRAFADADEIADAVRKALE